VSAYFALRSNAQGAQPLVLVDGEPYTPWVLVGKDLGSPAWQHQFSGARGTQGRRPSSGSLDNRTVTFGLLSDDHANKDELATDLAALARVVDDMRRFGGRITHREHNQTRRQHFEVLVAGVTIGQWEAHEYELRDAQRPQITATCSPYEMGDLMDVDDPFTTDHVNAGDLNYTADAGLLTNVAVTGGVLDASANLTTENRLIHTGTGYTYGDHEATVKATPGSTITSFKAGVILKRIDASNYLEVYVDDNGTNSRLRIDKVVATARTNLATTNLGARVVNGERFWARGRIEGNVVYAEHFLSTVVPNPVVAPTTSTSFTFTSAESAVFGTAIEGKAGLVFTPQQTAANLDDFEIRPFTYRSPPYGVLDCFGVIPGDAPALADARVGLATIATAPWAIVGWAPRASVENYVTNGGFEDGITPANQWSVAAVTGVTGAATSISAVADGTLGAAAKFGEWVGQLVCPATANTGATSPMYRRFRKGSVYTFSVWVRASAGTTTVRARLGVNGDIASSSAVALSTTWTEHTGTWTPTADVDLAYLAVEITAATATTFQLDGAKVYLGTTAPSVGKQSEGIGAPSPLALLQAEGDPTGIDADLTRTSDALGLGAFTLADSSVAAGGQTYDADFYVEPGLMVADDYTLGDVTIEVWARVMISAAFTGGVVAVLSATPEGGTQPIYTSEFGAVGRSIVLPSSGNSKYRMTRLGMLSISAAPEFSGRWKFSTVFTIPAGTNAQAFAVDAFYVFPRRSRFLSHSGIPEDTAYPAFLPTASTLWRTIRPDTSGTMHRAEGASVGPGVGGSLIELPTGQVSVLAVISDTVPDDPTLTTTSETQAFPHLHLAVTPRWHWLRTS